MRMKKIIIVLILSIISMFFVPFVLINYFMGNDAIGIFFILAVVFNPLVSMGIGIIGGWNKELEWRISFINSVIYFISSIIIAGLAIANILLAAIYFIIGIVFTYITMNLRRKISK